jgi:hypothetical protein
MRQAGHSRSSLETINLLSCPAAKGSDSDAWQEPRSGLQVAPFGMFE